jgi:REP element-mobilizing transposase RayT
MAHPYPSHHPDLPYTGQHAYFLTFCTYEREQIFTGGEPVDIVVTQILRAAECKRFEIPAYSFMPDHTHIAFIKAAKQYSGYHFRQAYGHRLWQRYGFERVLRGDLEVALTIGYIIGNPVRAGLAAHPSVYPYSGSTRYSMEELLAICEYDRIC